METYSAGEMLNIHNAHVAQTREDLDYFPPSSITH